MNGGRFRLGKLLFYDIFILTLNFLNNLEISLKKDQASFVLTWINLFTKNNKTYNSLGRIRFIIVRIRNRRNRVVVGVVRSVGGIKERTVGC